MKLLLFLSYDHLNYFFCEKKQYWSRPGDRLAECCNVECFMSTNSMWKVIKTMGLLTDHNGLKLKQVQFRGDFRFALCPKGPGHLSLKLSF